MKLPIEWLSEYTEIKNSPEQIGEIYTYLEFMQDGPIKDGVIDLEVRQNRPDALSIIGLATEYSAKLNTKLVYPAQEDKLKFESPNLLINPKTENEIKRFIAVKIENIKVAKSPEYILERLTKSGIRTVNSVVDITNYVMLEYGIPMHVFDTFKLGKDCKLTLRKGKAGDSLETWLGDKIEITSSDIVVANDEDKVVSIGGITGEKNSGATDSTTSIILESANYNQSIVRQSAVFHNLLTDSANRHNKILASNLVETAIRRAVFLIQEICGGEIVTSEDYYPEKQKNFEIEFKTSEIKRVSGIEIESDKINEILQNLRYKINLIDENIISVVSPNHRTDVKQMVDVIEDILRIYGYDKISEQPLNLAPPVEQTPKIYIFEDTIRNLFIQMGFDEHITEPLVKNDNTTNRIVLENSLNSEKNSLRITIEETLTYVLNNYSKHKKDNIKIFEIGKIYNKLDDRYSEVSTLGAIIKNFQSYKSAKGIIDTLFSKLGIDSYYLSTNENNEIINIYVNNLIVGFIKFSIKDSIYFEINLEKVLELKKDESSQTITKIPFEHEQILNLIVNKNTLYSEINKIINSVNSNNSTQISSKFIEEYKDDLLEKAGKKSYLLSLKIQSLINPVSKEEFKPIKETILEMLKRNLDIDLKDI